MLTDSANFTVSGNDMYSSGSGDVGIGINNPSSKLHVDGTLKVTGNTYSYDNVAAPIYGWDGTATANTTVQTICPSDLEQRDASVFLPGWSYSDGNGTGTSYLTYRNYSWVSFPIPYGYTPSRVYFNFAGDGPQYGFRIYASPVSANLTSDYLTSTSSTPSTGWFTLSPSYITSTPGWYVWIIFDEGAAGDWKFAGGMIEYTRNGW